MPEYLIDTRASKRSAENFAEGIESTGKHVTIRKKGKRYGVYGYRKSSFGRTSGTARRSRL